MPVDFCYKQLMICSTTVFVWPGKCFELARVERYEKFDQSIIMSCFKVIAIGTIR